MAQELGTGYIIISPSTKGLGKAIEGDISQAADKASTSSSKSILKTMGGALGKVGKIGIAGVSAIGGALVGLAAKGGFERALNVERAQTKLKALGHDTKSVDAIMSNALASVKGTAFGMGDAASAAAGLIASGIKQGKELETVLTTVGDVAQISGRSFTEIGTIFNKVAATGKLQGDEMLQLMESGIPVLQYLADHFQVTAEEAQKMVSDGKVSFADFEAAMREHLGGAAKNAGESFDGMVANVKAALSRLGEGFETPLIGSLTKLGNKLIPVIDKIVAATKPLQDAFAGRLATAVDKAGSVIDDFSAKLDTGEVSLAGIAAQLATAVGGFGALAAVGPHLEDAMGALDQLGASGQKAAGMLKQAGNNIAQGITAGFDGAKTSLTKFAGYFNSDLRDQLRLSGDFGADIASDVAKGLTNVKDTISNSRLGDAVSALAGNMRSGFSRLSTGIGGQFSVIGRYFNTQARQSLMLDGDPLAGVVQKISGGMGRISGSISQGFSKVSGVFGSLASNIGQQASKVGDMLAPFGDALGKLGPTVSQKLQSGLSTVGGVLGKFFSPGNLMKVAGVGAIAGVFVAALGAISQGMGGQLDQLVTQLTGQFSHILAEVGSWVRESLPTMMQAGVDLLSKLLEGVQATLPLLVSVAGAAISTLCEGIAQALPTLIPMGVDLIMGLIESLVAQIPMLLQAGLQLLQGLADGIIAALPVLTEQLPVLIQTILDAVSTGLPMILEQGSQILLSLINGLVTAMPQLVAMLPVIIDSIINFLTGNLPQIIETGVQVLVALINGLSQAIPQLVSYLPQIIASIVQCIASNLPQILESGVQVLLALGNGLVQAIPQLLGMIPQIITGIKDAFTSVDWGEIGRNLLEGIKNGIMGAAGSLWEGAKNAVGGMVDKVKGWLGIHSPSTLMDQQVGQMIGEGIAQGITNSEGSTTGAAAGMVDSLTAGFDGAKTMVADLAANVGEVWTQLWTGLNATATSAWQSINTTITAGVQTITASLSGGSTGIGVAWQNAWRSLTVVTQLAWQSISATVTTGMMQVGAAITGASGGITAAWQAAWQGVAAATSIAWSSIRASVRSGVQGVTAQITANGAAMRAAWQMAQAGMAQTATAAWTKIRSTVQSAVTQIRAAVASGIAQTAAAWSTGWNMIRSTGANIWNAVRTQATQGMTQILRAVQNGVNQIRNAWNSGWNAIRSGYGNIWNGLRSGTVSGINGVVSATANVKTSILNIFNGCGTWLYQSGVSIMDGLASGIRAGTPAAVAAAKSAMEQVNRNMPHSPAPEGPFSGHGWTLYSGMSIMQALGDGIAASAPDAVQAAEHAMGLVEDALDVHVRIRPSMDTRAWTDGIADLLGDMGARTVAGVRAQLPDMDADAQGVRLTDLLGELIRTVRMLGLDLPGIIASSTPTVTRRQLRRVIA